MAWDESKVKRVKKGVSEGGQFTTKEGIERAGTAAREAAGLTKDGWRTGSGDIELAKRFMEARNRLAKDKAGFLSDYTADELAKSGKRIFLHEDGENGFLVDNGDLQNLFSTNRKGSRSVLLAIEQGAKTLDCFDGFLPGYYSGFGFKEYKREANWTPGGPDVVFMRMEKKE